MLSLFDDGLHFITQYTFVCDEIAIKSKLMLNF